MPPQTTTSQEQQRAIIQQFQVTYGKALDLRVSLWMKGRDQEAEQVQAKNKELERKIDQLVGKLLDDWAAEAETLVDEGRSRNRKLQARLRDIERDIEIGEKVSQAIGFIDDAVKGAADILAKIP